MTRADWIFRPILWFTTASTIQVAIVRARGPIFSLIAGVVFWLIYRRKSQTAAGLPLLYLSAIGIAMFFGNLMSAAFVGDFSGVSRYFELSTPVRYALSAAGAVGSAGVMFWLGRQLRQWMPDKAGRAFAVIAIVVLPVVAGTALVILINQPVPAGINFTSARIGEQSFQVFAVIGAATGARRSSAGRSFRLRWIDGTILIAAVLVVRIMALGVHLTP